MKKVIVCDSGLGGLNIASHFFAQGTAAQEKCELIYINACPSPFYGFNKLSSDRKQEEVFRDVLESMKKFEPDLCLIACNTLSIIYERLKKWYTPGFEVAGIIDIAVDAMFEAMQSDPGSSVLILGTKTTVGSGSYSEKLIAKGIDPERIKGLACPGLATLLESDPASTEVQKEIAQYAEKAVGLFETPPQKLFCALCCTHFGFASKFWIKEFSRRFSGFESLVNPNDLMGNEFSAENFRYCSRIDFYPGAKEAMSRYFEKTAPQLSSGLLCAECDPGLFPFSKE